MLKEKIIRYPFRCLFIIFLIIYILSSFLISYLVVNSRLESISEVVLNTLHRESNQFQDIFQLANNFEESNLKTIKSKIKKLALHNFVIVKIFDPDFNMLITSGNDKLDKKFYQILSTYENRFLKKIIKHKHKKFDFFVHDNFLYLIIIKKLKSGFIEAIYKVPPEINKSIKASLVQSIQIVSFILLIAFFITFSIVNSFTKTIKEYSFSLLKENILSLQTIGTMIAKRDSETGEHNYRVTYYAVKIAENFPYSIDIPGLIKGAFLHDIGKIAIPDSILLKPGKLTDEEYEIMKTHVFHGYEIIKGNDFLEDAVDVVLYHHEKFDGSGYMKGLIGNEIPINARIFAVADVFDALTSERPYKKPFSFEKSMKIIKEEEGKHFCPSVVDVFEKIAEKIYKDISQADSRKLKLMVGEIILKYFSHELKLKKVLN